MYQTCTAISRFFLAFLLLSAPSVFAIQSPIITLDQPFLDALQPIGQYVVTASDDKSVMTPATIMRGDFDKLFESHGQKKTLSYGFNRRWPHWGYFTINNPDPVAKRIYLEASYSAIDYLTLSKVTANGEILSERTLGDKLPFTDRPVQYRHPIFELNLEPGLNHYLVKINTTSGVIFDFTLYDDVLLKNTKLKELIIVGILLGGILTVLFYNTFLFVSTRDSNYGLYVIYVASYFAFAMAYFGIAPYIVFSNWTDAPLTGWDLYLMIDGISVGSIFFAMGFLGLKKESPFFYKMLMGAGILCALNFTSNLFFLHGRFHQLLSLSIAMSFVSGIMLMAAGARMIFKGYAPATYYTIAWLFVIVGNSFVIFSGIGLVERNFFTTWSQLIGANLEMLLLSFALGARINLIKSQKLRAERQALKEAEEKKKLQAALIASQEDNIRTLDGKVKERTRDIREILTNINQGIFTFKSDLNLGTEFSDFLVKMVGHGQLAGKSLQDAIFSSTNLSANQISQTLTALEFAFGQDIELGWEANKGRFCREFQLNVNGKLVDIEAEWGAITNDEGEVDKVLVALRDITELKHLRQLAERSELESTMLLEMLANDVGKTQKFLGRTLVAWREIDAQLHLMQQKQHHDDAYARLFRSYHTIKGNARSLGFARIADQVHDVETLLKEEKTGQLLAASDACRELIKSYETLFMEKFARFFNQPQVPKGRRLEDFFSDLITPSVQKVAKDLGKPIPEVTVRNPDGFMIMSDEIEDIAQNVFHHLVRNSIDHGIEESAERKRLGKREFGEITIEVTIDSQKEAYVSYRDDGRGLNLSRVYQLGLDKGFLNENSTAEQLVETIFQLGFSTAKKTTLISGRGIGMDAVRHYCHSLGGAFTVKMDQPIDEMTLRRIKSRQEPDVFATFSFTYKVNLRGRKADGKASLTA